MKWLGRSLLVLLLGAPGIAQAQFAAVVSDPGAVTQRQALWTQEALQWSTTIDTQRQAVQQHIAMVKQGATNLMATPLNLVSQLQDLMTLYNTALADVKGVGYTIDSAKTQWDQLYGAATSNQPLPARVTAIAQAIQQAGAQANHMQAIYTRLCTQTAHLQTALQASKAAPGSLAAQQAQAQLTGILSDQLATLTQIEATASRTHIMQIADDARTSEQAAANSQRWIVGFTDPDLKPVDFGQGKGQPLPQ